MSDMPMTRRAIIGAACVAPFSVPSLASARNPDDLLVQAWRALHEVETACETIFETEGDDAGRAYGERYWEPPHRLICRTPAHGVRGLAIKALMLIKENEREQTVGAYEELVATTRTVINRLSAQA